MTAAPEAKQKSSRLEWALFAVFILALATQLTNEFNNPDGIGYYAHLRSAALDRDLFYLNEFEALKMTPYFYFPSPTGYIQNQWPVGAALLWAPFFLAGRLVALVSGAAADGYTALDALAVTFASAFYGFLALWICLRMLLRRYSGFAAFTAVAGAWLGTSFFCYQFYFAMMAHSCSAFTAALFVYLWQRDRDNMGPANWGLLGAVAGLAAMTRTEMAVLAALPVIDSVAGLRKSEWKNLASGLSIYGLISFLCLTPQLVVWWTLNGSPFNSYQGSVNLLLANPHPLEVLFSAYHGLFSWSPVVAAALAGWVLRWRRDSALVVGTFFVFLATLYFNSCLIWWWGGSAFGARLFVGLFPLFAWGLAEFLSRVPRSVGVPLVVLSVAWTCLLLMQYLSGKIFLLRFYTFEELIENNLHILAHPLAYLKIFATPKFIDLPALPTAAGIMAATAGLFLGTKMLAGRFTTSRVFGGLTTLVLLAAVWLTLCRANSGEAIVRNSGKIEQTAEYTLEQLYEPFPLEYANYYVRSGRIDDAVEELQRLEKLLPGNPAVPVAQAGIYLMTGDRERARAKAEKAARMEMRHPETRWTLQRIARAVNK